MWNNYVSMASASKCGMRCDIAHRVVISVENKGRGFASSTCVRSLLSLIIYHILSVCCVQS